MGVNHVRALRKKQEKRAAEWYSIRSLLGYDWAIFYFMIGGREAGKSYATTEFMVGQWRKYGRPFYWLRLTDVSQSILLKNNAEKLIDPDLRRKYDLDLFVKGDGVYEVLERDDEGKIKKKVLMARVLALSTFYNDKGSGLFDKDFLNDPKMYYNICLDEMNRELNEKNSFDIVYAFTNQLENLVRSTKQRVRVICIGNYLEEASDILCAFNFLPEHFGRFKLKKKRAVIDYIEPSESYLQRRKGTIADILMPNASTFTNQIKTDESLVAKRRLIKPSAVIKFSNKEDTWFTLWDSCVIAKYRNEKVRSIAMRPYIDEFFQAHIRDTVITQFDTRSFLYKDLITFKTFQKNLELLKPRK
ncbi:MAG: phage DNA encapsidation protein [Methanobrevibacter sp.]|nr:phage DNA encapsidation protein [Methanobrevibacter sp.]